MEDDESPDDEEDPRVVAVEVPDVDELDFVVVGSTGIKTMRKKGCWTTGRNSREAHINPRTLPRLLMSPELQTPTAHWNVATEKPWCEQRQASSVLKQFGLVNQYR